MDPNEIWAELGGEHPRLGFVVVGALF